jgi:hypothetical protein
MDYWVAVRTDGLNEHQRVLSNAGSETTLGTDATDDARSKEVNVSNGEAIPGEAEKVLHDTLTVPDLASVEASFERTQLLVQQGPGVAAMGLDASVSIQAKNSLEKMLAHQLAAVHRAVMDQLAFAPSLYDASDQAKRLNSAAICRSRPCSRMLFNSSETR